MRDTNVACFAPGCAQTCQERAGGLLLAATGGRNIALMFEALW